MSNKGLFTYTTEIEPQKTIAEIQEVLVSHGAKSVMTNYTDDGRIESLSFMIEVDGQPRGIRLPCDPVPVLKVLEGQAREGKIPRKFIGDEHQALRVSWRIVRYWVMAQMAILETQMVKTGFKLLGGKIETTIQNQAQEGEVMELKEVEDDTK